MVWRLQPGDHLKVRGVAGFRALTHHAIYLGDGKIMHFTGGVTDKANATCKIDSLRTIYNYGKDKGMQVEVVEHPVDALPREVIVQRAKSRVGETGYNLFSKNCEHVVNWCIRGEMHSLQIQRLRSDPLGLGKEILQEQLEAGEGVNLEEICRTLLPPTVWQTAVMLQERVRHSTTIKRWKEKFHQSLTGHSQPARTLTVLRERAEDLLAATRLPFFVHRTSRDTRSGPDLAPFL
uniref:phospholipase A2 n=1 Tax=Hanusia phi TaxID=3032 RepID=A0A7S0E9Q2_9CRYP